MTSLFSKKGLARLDEVARPGLLCAFDFDGTLAPIVAEPDSASLPAELRQRLVELSACTPVAVITGRALEDIRERLGFEPDFVVGNHGIEGLPDWESRAQDYRRICGAWRDSLAAALATPQMRDSGVRIEDKRYSLSVHYRLAPEAGHMEAMLRRLLARLVPTPRIVAGKCVFNLLPEGAGDKGRAVEQLIRLSAARAAIYVGDDVTDEDVFRLRRDDLLSVRVEQAADSAAEFFLPRWQDIASLLDGLVARLCRMGASNWERNGALNSA